MCVLYVGMHVSVIWVCVCALVGMYLYSNLCMCVCASPQAAEPGPEGQHLGEKHTEGHRGLFHQLHNEIGRAHV